MSFTASTASTYPNPNPPPTPSPSPPHNKNKNKNTNNKPIFLATHPRSCSTAFERVMMTRQELNCIHEPFGEAFYYSETERLGRRFDGENMRDVREKSGFSDCTFGGIWRGMMAEGNKRIFIKDIAHYLIPPINSSHTGTLSPSLQHITSTLPPYHPSPCHPSPLQNPTIMPLPLLSTFHWTFLIRSPLSSIPSYYRCTQPPLSSLTGFTYFLPEESGYRELRLLFDYLRSTGILTPENIFILDADDLLEHPEEAMKRYCDKVGVEYRREMLSWEEDSGCEAFEKWKGFHEDAIGSRGLVKREKRGEKGLEGEYERWKEKWGWEAAEMIRETCLGCWEDYEYLRGFKENF
ncbi:P-loop containing nucleoside triphosphate hydrolase protein [Pyronema omphalodes]|nr:P-loop containing nucleoside triphosphate hydrolase protein [Pyronema omphalodes]